MSIPQDLKLYDAEYRFALVVWEHEPVRTGELARLCAEELGWKRTTTYTVLKKLCAKGIFRNENSIVTALVKKEQVQRYESQSLLEKSFGGSLPRFITAFLGDRQLSQEEADELQALIDRHRQAEKGAEREGRDAQ